MAFMIAKERPSGKMRHPLEGPDPTGKSFAWSSHLANLNSKMEQRIQNSEHVGSTLMAALRTIQAQKASRRQAAVVVPQRTVTRPSNKLPIRVAMKRRKLIARGSGVFEDQNNGDIWFREGEFLVRQAVDTTSIVEQYLESCRES